MSSDQSQTGIGIKGTIICLPVRDLEQTLAFYRKALSFSEAVIEDGIIALELPNLSLFLMDVTAFEAYSGKAGAKAHLPDGNASVIISCAMVSREALDALLRNVPRHGGTVRSEAAIDELAGGYAGYIADPDGHLWEMVVPQSAL